MKKKMFGVMMCFVLSWTATSAQEKIEVSEIISGFQSNATKKTEWRIGVVPKMDVQYNVRDAKDTNRVFFELELVRESPFLSNAVGYSPFDRGIYTLHTVSITKGKFPVGAFVYGEYTFKADETFLSCGPQIKVDKCTIALSFGSQIKEWKPTAGIIVFVPFMTSL